MSTRIFHQWGIEVFKDLRGYFVRYDVGDIIGTIAEKRISKKDAEEIMSGQDGAIEVIDRIS